MKVSKASLAGAEIVLAAFDNWRIILLPAVVGFCDFLLRRHTRFIRVLSRDGGITQSQREAQFTAATRTLARAAELFHLVAADPGPAGGTNDCDHGEVRRAVTPLPLLPGDAVESAATAATSRLQPRSFTADPVRIGHGREGDRRRGNAGEHGGVHGVDSFPAG